MITQSDIVRLLATIALNSNHAAAGELKTATLEAAHIRGSGVGAELAATQVKCIMDSAAAHLAIDMMEELRVSSVPVLSTAAGLGLETTTIMSVADIQAVHERDSLKLLGHSVLDLIKGRRARQMNITGMHLCPVSFYALLLTPLPLYLSLSR